MAFNQNKKEEKKQPMGDLFAIVSDDGEQLDTVELGAVWESDKGALTFELRTWPVAWTDHRKKRRMMILPRKR